MKILKISMTGLFIVALFCGIIILPEYMMKEEDEKYVEKYNLYDREASAYILSSLSIEEKLEILSLGEGGCNITQILTIASLENLKKSDKALLERLSSNVKKMEKMDILPRMDSEISWEEAFNYAELINLSMPENSGIKVLQVWYLEFYNDFKGGPSCFFLIDANTYQVYEVAARNYEYGIGDYKSHMWEKMDEKGWDYLEWIQYWLLQYASYLVGEDAEIVDVNYASNYDSYVASDANAEMYGLDFFDIGGCLRIRDINYEISGGIIGEDSFYFCNSHSNMGLLVGNSTAK